MCTRWMNIITGAVARLGCTTGSIERELMLLNHLNGAVFDWKHESSLSQCHQEEWNPEMEHSQWQEVRNPCILPSVIFTCCAARWKRWFQLQPTCQRQGLLGNSVLACNLLSRFMVKAIAMRVWHILEAYINQNKKGFWPVILSTGFYIGLLEHVFASMGTQ